MTQSRVLAAALVLVVPFACGDDDGPPASTIGQPCGGDTMCTTGEMCLADQPGGLCVRTCTTSGEATECPAGALCDTVNVTRADGGVVDMVLCLQECDRDEDCRAGYSCNGVSSGTGKVCQPI